MKIQGRSVALLLLIIIAAVAAETSQAREMSLTYLGVHGGAGAPSDADAGVAWGATFGRRMTPDFGVGAYFLRMQKEVEVAGAGPVSNTFSAYGVEGNYYASGDMDGLVVGMKLGLATRDVEAVNASGSTTPVSLGPKLAFDHKFSDSMSVGFEANVLFQSGHSGQGAYRLVSMLGALKLWF